VDTVEQFRAAVEELGYPQKPVCFKPSISNGSRGFRIINENINEAELLFKYKPNNTFISLKSAVRILSSAPFPELLVTEYLPGEEYSVDCLANEGESILIIPRLRKKMQEGISIAGEFIKNEKIIRYCRDIIRELKLNGNIGVQVKGSSANEYLILEINPRVQGTISSALGAGVNLPLLAVKQALGENLATGEMEIRWGTKFSRYWQEVFY
jgi:carbamoyl-phosphate synthase large subunit